jgi:hypothetical protein
MKVVEQVKDEYGNLMQLWGIYEINENVLLKKNMAYPHKKKKLLRTFESIFMANKHLKNEKP